MSASADAFAAAAAVRFGNDNPLAIWNEIVEMSGLGLATCYKLLPPDAVPMEKIRPGRGRGHRRKMSPPDNDCTVGKKSGEEM